MCSYLVVEYVRPQQFIGALYGARLGQVALGTATVAFFVSGRWFRMHTVASWLLLIFTGVIVASSIFAYNPAISFDKLRNWLSWVLIFFLISNVINTKQRFAFFVFVWLGCHTYMAQGGTRQFAMRGFRFAPWGLIGAPGWFANSGEFAIAMSMYSAVAWHYYVAARSRMTRWGKVGLLSMVAMGVLCVIGSSSRGSELGLLAIAVCLLLRSKRFVRTGLSLAVAGFLVWAILPAEQKARFATAGDDHTSLERKVYWLNGLDMVRSHPTLGIGYENWMTYYSTHYRDSEASDTYNIHTVQVSHNIFIQCMAELGYTGLIIFLALIFSTLWINRQTRKAVRRGAGPPDELIFNMALALDEAMIGYLVAGFFVTVLYYPFFWINLALTVALAGIAARRAPVLPVRRGVQRRAMRARLPATPATQR